MQNLKNYSMLLVLLFFTGNAIFAQKLPSIQKNGVYAPINVKVDGKPTEWGNKFEAYNKANQIYYTMANDAENLYLVIQADRIQMVQKTMMAGITVTINSSKKKEDKNAVSVTFPVMKRPEYQKIMRIALTGLDGADYHELEPIKDSVLKTKRLDSIMQKANAQIPQNMKMIGVKGFPDVQDSLISVYNEVGIQLSARFDNRLTVTYELAIPLKYLGLSATKPGPVAYHIVLNGGDTRYINTGGISFRYMNGTAIQSGTARNMDIVSTTDLWGEYTLAKK
ncbi:hypothetical protein KXQ82_19685 [Mucilaginibacter sp. HMF5004]|uniref:hypothetical protein n=1 Tax=Mucilaginibacter rivuli TaxID=2857527 RepID=UPI001C5D8FDD|nr:hypothetical protein [Mucilaginibacter rivuli]MBW4891956.1 hypothetical protein [Mucilaginibacter rivuli]